MQHREIGLCMRHLLRRETVNILLREIICLRCKALPLNARHIEHIELADCRIERGLLAVFTARIAQQLADILRRTQLGRRDQHKLIARIAGECLAERMHGSAVEQVAAETHGEMFEASLLHFQRQQIGKRLCRVEMPAVARIDNAAVCGHCRRLRAARQRVPDDQNIRIGADDLCRVLEILALRDRGAHRIVEADDAAAEPDHRRLKAHLRAGRGLIEQRRHDLSGARLHIALRVMIDRCAEIDDLVPPLHGVVVQVDQVGIFRFAHILPPAFFACGRGARAGISALLGC